MDMDTKERSVSGFLYENPEMYSQALKEAKAVEYINDQIDMEHPQMVLQAYQQLIHQELFHTQVGYDFLKKMQGFLYAVPEIAKEDIMDIPVQQVNVTSTRKETKKKRNVSNHKIVGGLLFVCIVLLIMVIAMFAITLSSDNPTILNYQEKIVDQYATWEESLDQREEELNQRQEALDEKEDQLKQQSTQANSPADTNMPENE